MKRYLLILALALAPVCALHVGCGRMVAADLKNRDGEVIAQTLERFVSIGANVFSMIAPVYNRVDLSDWIQLNGKQAVGAQTVTVSDNGPSFRPEHTTILVKHEPTVTKREDGTWAITFKATK